MIVPLVITFSGNDLYTSAPTIVLSFELTVD